MRCVQLAILMLCVTAAFARLPIEGFCPECFGCMRYATRTYNVRTCVKTVVEKYKSKCGFWGWDRCSRTRSKCVKYKTTPTTRRVCDGERFRPGCRCRDDFRGLQ